MPALDHHAYLILKPLAKSVREFADQLPAGRPLTIVDVGCGAAPYRPFFTRPHARYIGIDAGLASGIDVRGASSALPVRDAVADGVICTQVLEHVPDPARALREIGRILRRGGRAFVSTHGVYVWHGSPHDFWRWTREGLRREALDAHPFSRVRIESSGGGIATLAVRLAVFLNAWAHRLPILSRIRTILVPLLNRHGERLDRRLPIFRATLAANYAMLMEK